MLVQAILTVLCLGLAVWFIRTELTGKMGPATVWKGCASLMFVCLGAWNLSRHGSGFGTLVMIGLVLGMVGDVLLNMRFLYTGGKSNRVFAVGILAFLSGHFLYIAALLGQMKGMLPAMLVVTAVISAASIPPLMRQVTAPSRGLRVFGVVYLAVVIAMFSAAAVLTSRGGASPLHVVFAVGAFFFLISDFLMIYYSFGKKIRYLRVANLMCYYVGQLLIAYSVWLVP